MERVLQRIKDINIDIVGATLSIVCGIHCVVFPMLMMAQPMLENNILFSHEVEQAIILISLIIASSSFTLGYLKHKVSTPFMLFAVSFAIILGIQLEFLELEILFMPIAGFLLAIAHIHNHRLLH